MGRERKNPYKIEEKGKLEPKKVYILACEGAETEKIYFEGISDEKEVLGINANIKVEVLEKEDRSLSHPIHVIKELDRYKEKFDLEEDELCLIIDRDCHSFKENQYDQILRECKKKGYNLYLSNPSFEFWLILHLINEELDNLDKKKLLENKKENEKNFTEIMLEKITGKEYNKKIEFETYKEGILKAVDNSKSYEENILKLKNSLGTNMQNLIKKFLE